MFGAKGSSGGSLGMAPLEREGTAAGEPAAGAEGVGRRHGARDGHQRLGIGVDPRHRAQEADRVGVLGVGEERRHRCRLDHLAGVHDERVVADLGHHAEVVGDQHDRRAARLLEVAHQRQDLRLDGDVEGRGRLVGDQHRRVVDQRHGDHHPLAHAAGELVRVVVGACRPRAGMRTRSSISRARASAARRPIALVAEDRLDELIADREGRVERGHRLLEDHRQPVAAQRPHRVPVQPEQVRAIEDDPAAGDAGRRRRQEPHDRKRGDTLAATGLADDAEGAAGVQPEIDTVHHRQRPIGTREVNAQVGHLEGDGWIAVARQAAAHSMRIPCSRVIASGCGTSPWTLSLTPKNQVRW